MRLRSLAAFAAAALAVSGCFGPPENVGPSVNASASTHEAAVGEPVVFTGAALDPDGSIVRFEWDFDGDGVLDFVNATRGTAAFTYSRPGNFTATFVAFDERGASATTSLFVSVVARFFINADWGADAGFLIHTASGLNPALMHVRATPTGAPAAIDYDIGAGLTALNNTTLRISMPRASMAFYNETRVEVTYNGTKGGERLFRAVPFLAAENDPALVFRATTTETRLTGASNATVTQSGTLTFHYAPTVGVASFGGTGTSSTVAAEGGVNASASYALHALNWNHSITMGGGSFSTTDYAWSSTGVARSESPGGFATNLTFSLFEGRRYLGNLTFERAAAVGTYTGAAAGTSGAANYSLFGNQSISVTDGNGIVQRALVLTETSAFNGTLGGASYVETNISERLEADSDRFVNPGIFAAWNATGRVGTTNLSDSGSRYLDANGDGHFNPDLRPAFPSDGQYFNGLAPAEFEAGDAFLVTNGLGASATLTVGATRTEVLLVTGFAAGTVEVATLSGSVTGGGLTGALEADAVVRGAHPHVRMSWGVDLASATGSFSGRWVLAARGA